MKTNVREFKNLIKRYESITLEEIQHAWDGDEEKLTITQLTGFRKYDTCSLCRAKIGTREGIWSPIWVPTCSECLHTLAASYIDYTPACIKHQTYTDMVVADSPEDLLTAVKERAKYLRTVLDKLNYKQP